MAIDKLHPPPKPTVPREAPWRELENISSQLAAILTALTGLPPGVPPTIPPFDGRIDTIITKFDSLIAVASGLPPGVPAPALNGRLDKLTEYVTHVPVLWSKVTSGSETKIIDRTQNWETNMWKGYMLSIIEGTGIGQIRIVKSNDIDSLVPKTNFSIKPDNTSIYVIWQIITPSMIRWGTPREPTWTYGSETTAPGAEATLVSKTVSSGKTGKVFGISISSPEANDFRLYSGTTVKKRYSISAAGAIEVILANPIIDDVGTGTAITIKNVNAGAAGLIYKADLLYDEA